jgi:hypothetical protein
MKHVLMIMLLVPCACTKPEAEVAHPDAAPPAADDGRPAMGEAPCDFCRPEAAVQTFISACAKKDTELLARCFSADSEGEFQPIVEGTASDKDLDELQEMFDGAEVAEASIGADEETATVRVNLTLESRPHEDIKLVKEGEEWKIQGF